MLLICIMQTWIPCVKWISFNSCKTGISSFLVSQRHFKLFSIVVCDTFNISAISFTIIWWSKSITALVWSTSTSISRPEYWSSLIKISPARKFFRQYSDCVLLRSQQYKLHISLCEPYQLYYLYGKKK